MTRRPAFWVAYALAALASLGVAAWLFPLAIPLVNLEVKLARHEAIARAEDLAQRLRLAPEGARAAAEFAHDGRLQDYVELEAGGKDAFASLVAGDRYAPYRWSVRLFRPGEIGEATIRFRPDGAADGFVRRVADDYVRDPSAKAQSVDDARAIAEANARDDWNVDLARWRPLSHSQETRANGRVDHAFVYEQPEPIGEARIRLRLGVAGDELTEVTRFVQIPESFSRRYQELRSANDLVAGIAGVAAGLLYGVGGCIVGVLWLLRKRWLLWRPALRAGLVVGGLLAATVLAAYPAQWMSFDTASDEALFWVQHVARAGAAFAGGGLALALVFMAAESLTRRAFPDHPQLWRLWSREGGASVQTLGRTLGGYLFVPVELAFVVAFYYATNRWLGWWQPSESLTDPNVLASAVPALQPIALSLQAGFMEECLFRAVPLALGALIGQHFGRRGTGIAVAFVLQAVVFGAAHANYPGFPSYSRLVELVLPSLAWAWIFLRFGLLPVILLHALFDLVLMSVPLFLVDAPGGALQRAIVVLAGALPLLVVAWRRWRMGAFIEMPPELRNGAWHPADGGVHAQEHRATAPSRWRNAVRRALPAFALAGVAACVVGARVETDVPPLAVNRAQAIAAAEKALEARGAALGPDWRRAADIRISGDDAAHTFVWREAGPERYRELVGAVLPPPLWEVRFARFDGDVADRAEEWRVSVDGGGRVRVVNHALPEARPGARLARDEALAIAAKAVDAQYGLDVADLRLVGAYDQARPARTDWAFVWHDPRVDVGSGGEARLRAAVLGDEPTGVGRFVHVPEAWARAERLREQRLSIARLAASVLVAVVAVAALVIGIVAWSRGHSDRRASLWVALLVLALGVARTALSWPEYAFALDTTEPVVSQVAIRLAVEALSSLMLALLSGLLAGVGAWWARAAPPSAIGTRMPPWLAGASSSFAILGVAVLASHGVADLSPSWPSYAFEDKALPWLAAALQPLRLPAAIGVALFALAALTHYTANGTRRAWMLPLLLALLFGIAVVEEGTLSPLAIAGAMVTGAAAAAIVEAVVRAEPRSVPAFVATGSILTALDGALEKATTGAFVHFALQAIGTLVVAWICTRYLARPLPPQPTADVLAKPAA